MLLREAKLVRFDWSQPVRSWRKLTKAQQEGIGWVCMGQSQYVHPKTLKRLEAMRLIKSHRRVIYGRGKSTMDRIPVTVLVYEPVGIKLTELWARMSSDER